MSGRLDVEMQLQEEAVDEAENHVARSALKERIGEDAQQATH